MASPSCVSAISTAAGRQLSQSEAEDVERAVLRRRAILAQRSALQSDPEAFAQAARELAGEEALAALIEKRSRAINVQTKLSRFARYDANVGKEVQTIREMMVGREGKGEGAANSVDAQQLGIRGQLLGGLIADLRKADLLDVFGRHVTEFDRDVARELWKLGDTDAPGTSNRQAQQVAKILNKYQEQVRLMQNDSGAWIGKETGYITRQSHDPAKIMAAGFETWRADIEPRLADRTFDDVTDRDAYLRDVWTNLATGNHQKATGGSDWLGGFKGPGNLAKKASQERSLIFKSADDWFDYNTNYGTGSMMESIFKGLEHGSRNTALMRVFGTNPRAAFESDIGQLVQRIKDRGSLDGKDLGQIGKLNNWYSRSMMDQLDGSANISDVPWMANVGATTRALASMAKLGGVVFSSLPDLATVASTLRHNGVPFLESWGAALRGSIGDAKGLNREIADLIGVGIDSHIGGVLSRFHSGDTVGGKMSKMMDVYFKANLLTWWTDSHKTAAGLMLARNLANNAETAFGDLHPYLANNLSRYGINEPKWDLVRQAALRLGESNDRYLTPDAIRYLDDAKVRDYLGDPEASAATIGKTKDELETNLSAYYAEQVRESMTEGGAREKAMLFGESRKGTPIGEAWRLIAQFKQFPTTFITRHLAREFTREGSVDKVGLAQLIATTTAMGYMGTMIKDALKGESPRDPRSPSTWAAAFTAGGGAGIFGDWFLGKVTDLGSFAGPVPGTIVDLIKLWGDSTNTSNTLGQHAHQMAGDTLRLATSNIPFINIAYTKMALDYLVLYHLQEMVNPGYLKRYESRVEKTQHQTFFLRPSDTIARGGGFR